MKNIFLSFLLLSSLLFFGCSSARFAQVPGNYQDFIPQEIQGNYRFISKDIRSKAFDSLLLEIGQNEIRLKTSGTVITKTIHLDFKIHRIGELYVLGTPDQAFPNLWNLSVIQPANDGIRIYFINEVKKNRDEPSKFEKYFEPKEFTFHSEPLANAPQVVSNGGMETPPPNPDANRIKYFMPSDEQFKIFFNEELKDKEYIFLPTEKAVKRGRR